MPRYRVARSLAGTGTGTGSGTDTGTGTGPGRLDAAEGMNLPVRLPDA